jgi:hypothetical protein
MLACDDPPRSLGTRQLRVRRTRSLTGPTEGLQAPVSLELSNTVPRLPGSRNAKWEEWKRMGQAKEGDVEIHADFQAGPPLSLHDPRSSGCLADVWGHGDGTLNISYPLRLLMLIAGSERVDLGTSWPR